MSSTPALLLDASAPLPGAGEGLVVVRVAGSALGALDVHDGDRVLVARGREPEHGDLAALHVAGGACTLWKVSPEEGRLHLSNGRTQWTVSRADVDVVGVVVGLLRALA